MAAETATAAPPEPWNMTLPERLKRARIAAGISSAEMADVLECSDRQIRNYESGASPIKTRDIRDWAMRCGGARIHSWITTGVVPADGPEDGTEQEIRQAKCIASLDVQRERRRRSRDLARAS